MSQKKGPRAEQGHAGDEQNGHHQPSDSTGDRPTGQDVLPQSTPLGPEATSDAYANPVTKALRSAGGSGTVQLSGDHGLIALRLTDGAKPPGPLPETLGIQADSSRIVLLEVFGYASFPSGPIAPGVELLGDGADIDVRAESLRLCVPPDEAQCFGFEPDKLGDSLWLVIDNDPRSVIVEIEGLGDYAIGYAPLWLIKAVAKPLLDDSTAKEIEESRAWAHRLLEENDEGKIEHLVGLEILLGLPAMPGDNGSVRLGALELTPAGRPRRTGGGTLRIPLVVLSGDQRLDAFTLSDSLNARRTAARLLRSHGAPDGAIDAALGKVLVGAAKSVNRTFDAGGETVAEIVRRVVPLDFRLTHRTARGAWSEVRDSEITRTQFVSHTPESLIAAAARASDAPRDASGELNRAALVRVVRIELEILWSSILSELPAEDTAETEADSAAARRFRDAMIQLWSATRTFEITKTVAGTSGEATASRASLISRVRTQAKNYLDQCQRPDERERWRRVQSGFDGFWRPVELGDGMIGITLAMRHSLTFQIGVPLPGARDQGTLARLCGRYGLSDPSDTVPRRLSGGSRLVVLARPLVEELLAEPMDENEDENDTEG